MEEKYLETFLNYYKKTKDDLVKDQKKINDTFLTNDNPNIKDNIKFLCESNQNGKYIRGCLITMANHLFGENSDAKMLAYAYELFETSILIHDDLIDNGDERRNLPTIPNRVSKKYNIKDKTFGNNIALCDGIYGYYLANNMILDNYKDNKYLSDILHLYNDIVLKTVEGEILDVDLPFKCQNDLYYSKTSDIMEIYTNKTAWYTIIGPFLLGMMLNGKKASDALVDVLKNIGIAFQIKDDLLGIFASNLGKSLTDIEEYKQTILFSHILETDYKGEFLKVYGTKGNDEKVKELLEVSGTRKYTEDYLMDIYNTTKEKIDSLEDLSLEGKDLLKGLLLFIIKREK